MKQIFLSCRLGIYSFTKNEVTHRCSSRILVALSSDSFSDSHFQVGSFVKRLLGTKITLTQTTPSIFKSTLPPSNVPYPPINIEFFSGPPPFPPQLFNIRKTPYPPCTKTTTSATFFSCFNIVKGGGLSLLPTF